jgi:hypothetical protein
MRCGVVKMQYRFWGTCTAPAVQNVGKWLEYFSQKDPLSHFYSEWEPINEDRVVYA